ncbi:MAG: helix-turn-helix domain-containing protein [Desulfuromusa sp.]|nr:helix-turn-helix domain-containing protein [Desulfuromusa sp.]
MRTEDQVIETFRLRGNGLSIRAIADSTRTNHNTVYKILSRKSFRDVNVTAKILHKAELVNRFYRKRYREKLSPDNLGDLVRYRRQGLNQTQIAEQLGVSQPCISRWIKRIRAGEII